MFLKYKCLIILLLFLTGNMMTEAQELIAPTDTVMAVVGDTVVSAGQDSVLYRRSRQGWTLRFPTRRKTPSS